jgi:hypothetical protein
MATKVCLISDLKKREIFLQNLLDNELENEYNLYLILIAALLGEVTKKEMKN